MEVPPPSILDVGRGNLFCCSLRVASTRYWVFDALRRRTSKACKEPRKSSEPTPIRAKGPPSSSLLYRRPSFRPHLLVDRRQSLFRCQCFQSLIRSGLTPVTRSKVESADPDRVPIVVALLVPAFKISSNCQGVGIRDTTIPHY